MHVLDYVFDLDRLMRETVRVVRPGGFVCFEPTGGFTETGAVDPCGAMPLPLIAEIVLDRDEPAKSRRMIVFRTSKGAPTKRNGT